MIGQAVVTVAGVLVLGALGGVCRYLLSRHPGGLVGTWLANMIGSFAAGLAFGLPGLAHTIVAAGFAGAISTLSTLAQELGELVKAHHYRRFAWYVAATVCGGLAFAWCGLALGA